MDTSTRYVCRHMMHSDVQQVRELHDQLFPVKYSVGFYSKLVNNPDGNITSLVLVDTEACTKTMNVPCEAEKKGNEEREDGCEDSVPTPAIIGVATCRVTDVEDSIVGYLLGHKAACKKNIANLTPHAIHSQT